MGNPIMKQKVLKASILCLNINHKGKWDDSRNKLTDEGDMEYGMDIGIDRVAYFTLLWTVGAQKTVRI